jgi:glycosyltransferase involved in cell wall biosynthesis
MGVYALSFCKKNKIPLITSFYGLDVYQHTRSPFYRWQLRQLFKYGILFLACSEKMRNDLIKLGAPADKTKVQYGGATLSRFPYSQRAPEKEITILMCGRFVEKKGFQYGIDAFNRISAEFPQVKLKIIGSGSLESVLKKAAGKNIEFLGAKSHAEYIEEIKKCHIFMSPSVTAKNGDSEGLPTVLIEAAAIGRPLIATKHSGIPEIVHDGKNGLLVPERDVPALADVLRKMLRKPEAWIDFSRYGRALVEKSFDLTKQAQKLEAYYLA